MAGHSKWANIKHRKAAQDAKRAKVWTKLIREITVSAREGGGDASTNPRLRAVMDKALAANMTRDTVDRAVKRGTGEAGGEQLETLRYEGYGPGGVAVLVECLTDNRVRTVGEVRHAFSKCGGNLGTDGSVAYLFKNSGVIEFGPEVDEDLLVEAALEAGVDDVLPLEEADGGGWEVLTSPEQYGAVADALAARGLTARSSGVTMRPDTWSTLEEIELAEKMLKLTDMLEDLDDVQEVYSNADFSAEVMAQLEARG